MNNYNIRPNLIPNTPVGISIYSVTQEACHYHEGFLEIIYCLKGNATFHASYEDIRLIDGDIISCDSHDIHALNSTKENLFVSFYFDLTHPIFNDPDLKDVLFVCERYVLPKKQQDEMQNLKHFLLTLLYFYCFPHAKVSSTETFNNLAVKILNIMQEHFHLFHYVTQSMDYTQDQKERFNRIVIYINQHYDEKITLSHLAEKEHVNPNHLSHFLKKTTLGGYSSFLNYIRTYQSEWLLFISSANISDISYNAGFSDPKFYYKSFKTWYGHTPLQHRKFFQRIEQLSEPNHYYEINEISDLLEHYISYYFATLHIPEFWDVPYIPFRNVPNSFLKKKL